jgi:uncharacterized protein YggE
MIDRTRRIRTMLCAGLLAAWSSVAHAEESVKDKRTVTVQGEGKMQAVPDIATLSVEVVQEGASLDEVSAQVRQQMTHVLDALKAQGIAEKDIQTRVYQVQPRYDNEKRGNTRRSGYVVSNGLLVKVRDLKKVGKVLSATVNAGATNVNGPDFDFDNPQQLEHKTLALAMDDAKAKAAVLAEGAGAKLGDVVTINQMGGVVWPVRRQAFAMRAMAMAATAEEPIATGEQSFTSNITVTFALR